MKQIPWNKGKHWSKEVREKIRAQHLGKKHLEKTKYKISLHNRMEKNYFWKGGKIINKDGYVLIKQNNHPFKNNTGYVREHRLVMEKHIGRYLLPEERVHHINGVKDDNGIENLKLFPNESTHRKFHINQ